MAHDPSHHHGDSGSTSGEHPHHDHAHGQPALRGASERRLGAALALTATFMLVEVVAGLLTHSLALLSDAGHMFADVGALLLALIAQRVASRPRTLLRTYGFRRAETLAAFANGIALGVSAVWIIVEAVSRWQRPPLIHGRAMLVVATGGLAINLLAAWVLSRGDGHNTNTRAALAHVLADAAGSVAAMLAAALVIAFGWRRADPAISIALSALILWSAWRLTAQAVAVLMEGVPPGLALDELERTISETPGVADLHDLHAWTISDGFDVVTVHVVLDGTRHGTEVARDVGDRIHERHRVKHVTVQPEPPAHAALRPADALLRRPN